MPRQEARALARVRFTVEPLDLVRPAFYGFRPRFGGAFRPLSLAILT